VAHRKFLARYDVPWGDVHIFSAQQLVLCHLMRILHQNHPESMTARNTSASALTAVPHHEEVHTLSALLPTVLVVWVTACHHHSGQPQPLAGNGKTVLESLSVLVAEFSASEDLVLPAEECFNVKYAQCQGILPTLLSNMALVCPSSPHENEESSSSPCKPVSDSKGDMNRVA
jgi:hypothetical protein